MIRTPSQTVGPYYAIGLCRSRQNELVDPAEPGAVRLAGRLLDGRDEPIGDGVIELWDAAGERWGRCGTGDDGSFEFAVAKPEPLPGHAPRLEAFVFARGLLRHQLTRIYFPDEPDANAVDPVMVELGETERATLVAVVEGAELRFDVRMQGERATVFFAH